LARLEPMVHPAVRPRSLAAIAEAELDGPPAIVIEAIKLVEGGLASLCDEVWLVSCEPADQLERLAGRGESSADAEGRIAAQAGLVDRLRQSATRVIDPSGPNAAARSPHHAPWPETGPISTTSHNS